LHFRDETVSPEILSGMFWVVIFFTAMSGLSRIFVSEEERGTHNDFAACCIAIGNIFWEVNIQQRPNISFIIRSYDLYLLVFPEFVIQSPSIFIFTVLFGGLGFASAVTIIAAIIAKAKCQRNFVPCVVVPILIPLFDDSDESNSTCIGWRISC